MELSVDHRDLQDLERAVRTEWLVTNGVGGYASSSVIGLNTRRYHGLLVAATTPPVGRIVMLAKCEETVCIGEAPYELSTNRYVGATYPDGYMHQTGFKLDPDPVFSYRLGGLEFEKRIFMVHGKNATVIEYGPFSQPVKLEIRPLLAHRDHHTLTRSNSEYNPRVEVQNGYLRIQPYDGLPPLYLSHNADRFDMESNWYYSFEYLQELHRGLDAQEDLHCPGRMTYYLQEGDKALLVAGVSPEDVGLVKEIRLSESHRLDVVMGAGDSLERALRKAADAFVVKRKDGLSTLLAGYPWFTDWGRDTMISLPGLTLVTGRFAEARSILEAYAAACRQGMIPNRFPDFGEEPDYNTVDASLWFFYAVDAYSRYTGDLDFVREVLWPVLVDIINWHVKGTRYGIGVAADGLLRAGEPGTQLTWMDAKVGDWVVTPRQGKPVEINALWYNALMVGSGLGDCFGDPVFAHTCLTAANACRASFLTSFWNEDARCLYDCIDDDVRDDSIRPNQIFALSLPYRMLREEQERAILEVVERDLITPVGLRSLSRSSPSYQGRYGGDQRARDGAYHQGTVWTWPIGAFVDAWVRLGGDSDEIRQEARKFVEPFREHLSESCIGQISEIFEGDSPHTARGCFAQAWSVAEVLRIYVEIIQGRKPTHTAHCVSRGEKGAAQEQT